MFRVSQVFESLMRVLVQNYFVAVKVSGGIYCKWTLLWTNTILHWCKKLWNYESCCPFVIPELSQALHCPPQQIKTQDIKGEDFPEPLIHHNHLWCMSVCDWSRSIHDSDLSFLSLLKTRQQWMQSYKKLLYKSFPSTHIKTREWYIV